MNQTFYPADKQASIAVTMLKMKRNFIKKFRSLVMILFFSCAASQPVSAQWSTDPNINTFITANSTDGIDQQIIPGKDGSMIIVWSDLRSGIASDIYAQCINANGFPEWGTKGIPVCTAPNDQINPRINPDGAGGVIIAWADYRVATPDDRYAHDVYAQRINAKGEMLWTTDGVAVCTAPKDQDPTDIIHDEKGGAIIAWNDTRNISKTTFYIQHINAGGKPDWTTDGVALTQTEGSFARLFLNGEGNTIITWNDSRGDASDVYAQMINAAGEAKWVAGGVVICNDADRQYFPSVISDGEHGAIISWLDYRDLGRADIYAQRIKPDGQTVWSDNGRLIARKAGHHHRPFMIPDDMGGAILTWDDYRNGNNVTDVYAQRVNAAGTTLWTEGGAAICTSMNRQYWASIAPDGASGAFITWSDRDLNGTENYDIYAQHITAAGEIEWNANGVAVCTQAGTQYYPAIVPDVYGGAVIAWSDFTANNASGVVDIYIQNISSKGKPGCITPLLTHHPLATQSVSQGSAAVDLTVAATGSNLNYQWFSNTTASTTGAVKLNSAGTGSILTPSTAMPGILYYYCMVTGSCDTLYSDFAGVAVTIPVTRLEVTVSPNPTESFFNVTVKSPNNEPVTIRMFDMLGRLVQWQHGAPGQTFKPGGLVAAGMYIIEVRQGAQTVITKAVKQ